ncbi:pyrroline-5-carboxylate reductase [[Eubacterium] cellulosolvens]
MIEDVKICVIGAGKMGGALIHGLISNEIITPKSLFAIDMIKDRCNHLHKKYGIECSTSITSFVDESDIIIIAVKPKDIENLAKNIKKFLTVKKLVITLAAGVSTQFLSRLIGDDVPIIRAMPNIAVLVNEGMIVLARGANSTDEQMNLTEKIFNTIGKVAIVEEKHMDTVTGLSGSGPAYVYSIIEAMSNGAIKDGLEGELALQLAAQTTLGAAKMILKTGKHPSELIKMVVTPGGTTEQGLLQLKKNKVKQALIEAVIKASEKSRNMTIT